jgi:predicted Zn-dependent protease
MRYTIRVVLLFTVVASIAALPGCSKLNLFSIEDDKALGLQTVQEIEANPGEYPVLSEAQYPQAYQYIKDIRDVILNSGQIEHKADFEWKVYIINRPDIQNAFCTPGGYIYVYTGLIKYLDNASSLAGVMGHEMAHADRRHSTKQMTETYGISTLLSFIGGNAQQVAQISAQLITLKFSRNDEKEADTYSVKYLCPTQYDAAGAANFFKKIDAAGGQDVPEFLSTHPNPDNRVTNIEAQKSTAACNDGDNYDSTFEVAGYQTFKSSLPN